MRGWRVRVPVIIGCGSRLLGVLNWWGLTGLPASINPKSAEAYNKSWKGKHPCEHLELLHTYTSEQGKGAPAFRTADAGAVAAYLAAHYAWAAKALVAGSAAGCAVFAAQLLLGAAEEVDGMGAEAAAAGAAADATAGAAGTSAKGRGGAKGKGAGGGGGGQHGAAQAAEAAAAVAFPSAAARQLLEAARGVDGFAALQVDVQEMLAVAEMAVARVEAGAAV